MATITEITEQDRAAFRERGFVVIPGVLDDPRLAAASELAAALLAAEPPGAELTGPYFLWPRFGSAGHRLLDLYRESGIGRLAAGLLRPDLAVREPDFAQLATTIPPWLHRPGGPHVDGLTPPARRTAGHVLAAGRHLADRPDPAGPGEPVDLAGHAPAVRRLPGRARRGRARPGRGDEARPVPGRRAGRARAGDGTGGERAVRATTCWRTTSAGTTVRRRPGRRQTVYYRLEAHGHRERWREAVTSPLLEFA